MKQKLLLLFALAMSSMGAWALSDGSIFWADVPCGDDDTVEMTFMVISEANKTCQVGNGSHWCLETEPAMMDSYYSKSGTVTIPATITYNDVTYQVIAIGDYAFDGWVVAGIDNLTGLILPEGLQTIGESFVDCRGITSLTIPSTVTNISEEAFNYMENLEALSVEAGNSVYDSRGESHAIIETATNTLMHASNTTVIPADVTAIGNYAFRHRKIRNVNLENITSIGKYAFYLCDKLDRVVIPEGITTIKESTFHCCYSLKSLYIPTSVTTIEGHAFQEAGLSSYFCIRSLIIPNSVNNVGDFLCYAGRYKYFQIGTGTHAFSNYMFYSASQFNAMTILSPTKVTTQTYTFRYASSSFDLYVPSSLTSSYGATWNNGTVTALATTTTYTVPASGIGTFCWNQNFTLPAGLEAYICTGYDGSVQTSKLEGIIPGYTGVLLKGTPGETYTITATTSDYTAKWGDNILQPVYVEEHIPATQNDYAKVNYTFFILKDGKFVTIADGGDSSAKMPAQRAFLPIETSLLPADSRSLDVNIDGTTNILHTKTKKSVEDNKYYNLNGQQVTRPTKGLYITNGKKVIIK
ncbi:MAG: leucine-rich repeat protein [Prevotella sp.]|nr:leucine-rich repeat protein [Prevotella sp.]